MIIRIVRLLIPCVIRIGGSRGSRSITDTGTSTPPSLENRDQRNEQSGERIGAINRRQVGESKVARANRVIARK